MGRITGTMLSTSISVLWSDLQIDLHAIPCDFPSRRVGGGTLGAVIQKYRVSGVNMDKHLALNAQIFEGGERPISARYTHVAHAFAGLYADPRADHLIIA